MQGVSALASAMFSEWRYGRSLLRLLAIARTPVLSRLKGAAGKPACPVQSRRCGSPTFPAAQRHSRKTATRARPATPSFTGSGSSAVSHSINNPFYIRIWRTGGLLIGPDLFSGRALGAPLRVSLLVRLKIATRCHRVVRRCAGYCCCGCYSHCRISRLGATNSQYSQIASAT